MDKKYKTQVFAALGLAASLGLHFVACLIIGLVAGKFLDEVCDSAPYFMAAGIIVGILAGGWGIYKKVINFER